MIYKYKNTYTCYDIPSERLLRHFLSQTVTRPDILRCSRGNNWQDLGKYCLLDNIHQNTEIAWGLFLKNMYMYVYFSQGRVSIRLQTDSVHTKRTFVLQYTFLSFVYFWNILAIHVSTIFVRLFKTLDIFCHSIIKYFSSAHIPASCVSF